MADDRQVPATREPASQLPFLGANMNYGINKASEKIEMQKVTAETYAIHQRVMQDPRDEEACFDTLLKLCENVGFASTMLYSVARGNEKVEGIGINGANEIARIWGQMDSGTIIHGKYGDEVQLEAFAIDLVSLRRRSHRFTVSATRIITEKDNEGNEIEKRIPVKNLDDIVKGKGNTEERNCILDIVPYYVREEVHKTCKRTIIQNVHDVPGAFKGCVTAFSEFGIPEDAVWRFINRKPGQKDRFEKVTAADIVELRLLYAGLKNGESNVSEIYPEGVKKGKEKAAEPAKEPPKEQEKKSAPSADPAPTPSKKTDTESGASTQNAPAADSQKDGTTQSASSPTSSQSATTESNEAKSASSVATELPPSTGEQNTDAPTADEQADPDTPEFEDTF